MLNSKNVTPGNNEDSRSKTELGDDEINKNKEMDEQIDKELGK